MPPIIEVHQLSKRYRISHRLGRYQTLRESISQSVRRMVSLGHWTAGEPARREEFWALRSVSFSVQPGEILGVIGPNGAGKTTLLKILSRITPPTTGEVILRGRVASLLEVGTGFHPELTGRENIFLNGAILGMPRAEILRKLDAIVGFAGVERFLDTPVKHYSAGMYVRLAFSIAAHLEPDVLFVDEVLAVGDAEFQRKSLGKMQEVAQGFGRTIVFVSHNMAAIQSLCQRCILLDQGVLKMEGEASRVISGYLAVQPQLRGDTVLSDPRLRQNSLPESKFKWTRLVLENTRGSSTAVFDLGEPFAVTLEALVSAPVHDVRVGLAVLSSLGFPLFNTFQLDGGLPSAFPAGKVKFRIMVEPNMLAPGVYDIGLGAMGPGVADWLPVAAHFSIREVSAAHARRWDSHHGGVLSPSYRWGYECLPAAAEAESTGVSL